eukprot:CAMPEP_0117458298 /NCGR_PEP_ID=MMETSP0784-20121206/857_1 /TAXON_ID=39447 /ORGANISM="" /LENGTH=60 /DNA_ID=CAMNT_0005251809 /DNA_START=76 /DNA_END=254 /DNA_ORIENTATION=-
MCASSDIIPSKTARTLYFWVSLNVPSFDRMYSGPAAELQRGAWAAHVMIITNESATRVFT